MPDCPPARPSQNILVLRIEQKPATTSMRRSESLRQTLKPSAKAVIYGRKLDYNRGSSDRNERRTRSQPRARVRSRLWVADASGVVHQAARNGRSAAERLQVAQEERRASVPCQIGCKHAIASHCRLATAGPRLLLSDYPCRPRTVRLTDEDR